MTISIDFSKGGYQGDIVEEAFKSITSVEMPWWWHFREVLRASDGAQVFWNDITGVTLADESQRELVALSLLNYAVYTGIGEAISFCEQMKFELTSTQSDQWRIFEVRKLWKAAYSSLYSSFNALCNIVYVLIDHQPPWGNDPFEPWNVAPAQTIKLVGSGGLMKLADPLSRCRDRLEIRAHLDHYWAIWLKITKGTFHIDENFRKGYVVLHPQTETRFNVDARQLTRDHISGCLKDYNLVYAELAAGNGHLDQHLAARGWQIDYSDFGTPHNGKRPVP